MASIDNQDPIEEADQTPDRVEGKAILQLWNETALDYQYSRENILLMRDMICGRTIVDLKSGFDDEAASGLVPKLPHRQQLPVKMTNTLSGKRPTIKRHPTGPGLRAEKQADDLESWINAVMKKVLDWPELVGRAVQDGEYGVITLPTTADWVDMPDFLDSLDIDDDGEAKAEAKTEEIPARKKRKTSKVKINQRYHRDANGTAYDEEGYGGKPDRKQSEKAYQAEKKDFLARRLPFSVRVVSATDCLPIWGPRRELEGLVVRTLYSRQSLIRRNYRHAFAGGTGGLLQPKEAAPTDYGQGAQVYLYEYYGLDHRGLPYVSYSAGGEDTVWGTDGATATIDLWEEYGLTKLPADYAYGLHRALDNPDERGMPLMEPLVPMMLNIEGNLARVSMYLHRTAFPNFVELPGTDSDGVADGGEKPKPLELLQGGGITKVSGEVKPLSAGQMSGDIKWLVQVQMESISSAEPSESATGGNGGASGYQMTLSREYLEIANSMILNGAGDVYASVASKILEIAVAISKKHGVDVPVYDNIEIPPTETTAASSMHKLLEVRKEWIEPIYDVEAEYPKYPSNIAEIQQAADLYGRGLNTFDDVREKMGDNSPATTRAKIFADRWYNENPQGQMQIAALAAKLRGDEAESTRLELLAGGQITEAGFPVGALDEQASAAEAAMAQQGQGGGQPGVGVAPMGTPPGPPGPVAPGVAAPGQPPQGGAPAATNPQGGMAGLPANQNTAEQVVGGIVGGAAGQAARMQAARAAMGASTT